MSPAADPRSEPRYLEQIQLGVDFIEARLDEDFALADVARAGALSQWHFQRIFRSLTGETLKGYIRARRLARSLDRLLEGGLRVLDIGLLAGFESQEAYARAFKKQFGLTPTEYRSIGRKSLFLHKLELDQDVLRHLDRNVSREPDLHEQRPMRLIGMRTEFYGPDSAKDNMSQRLPELWEGFLPRVADVEPQVPGALYGVVSQTRPNTDLLAYHAAVEVPPDAAVPPGMVEVGVPGGLYARFEHRGEAQTVDRTVAYAYSTWLIRSGMRHTSGPDLEVYDHRWHPTGADSVLTYALPVTAAG